MLPINLNLLSEPRRKTVQYIRLSRSFSSILIVAVLTYTLIAAMIWGGVKFLENESERVAEELRSNNKILADLNQEQNVLQVQDELAAIRRQQEGFILWSDIILEISRINPSGITIQNITFLEEATEFRLRGIADNRDTLLQYRDALRNSSVIEGVETPVSSLTQKENIPFQFTGTFSIIQLTE